MQNSGMSSHFKLRLILQNKSLENEGFDTDFFVLVITYCSIDLDLVIYIKATVFTYKHTNVHCNHNRPLPTSYNCQKWQR